MMNLKKRTRCRLNSVTSNVRSLSCIDVLIGWGMYWFPYNLSLVDNCHQGPLFGHSSAHQHSNTPKLMTKSRAMTSSVRALSRPRPWNLVGHEAQIWTQVALMAWESRMVDVPWHPAFGKYQGSSDQSGHSECTQGSPNTARGSWVIQIRGQWVVESRGWRVPSACQHIDSVDVFNVVAT